MLSHRVISGSCDFGKAPPAGCDNRCVAVASAERVRDDLDRLMHRGAGVREFSLGAARILARAVPFDGVCVVSIAGGRAATGAIASARVRTASGTWLLVRGTALGDDADAQTAVLLEPARPHELAPLIADAYALTDRERAVTQLIAEGLPTSAIADRLYISPWTVQDHLKSIFEKVGVSTRGELVARVFFEYGAARLTE